MKEELKCRLERNGKGESEGWEIEWVMGHEWECRGHHVRSEKGWRCKKQVRRKDQGSWQRVEVGKKQTSWGCHKGPV